MIPLLTALFGALTEACKAYTARLAWDQFNQDATDEDAICLLLAEHTAAADLRAAVLSERIKRRRTQPQRSA
ncbi:MAG: hypothetical protein WCK77_23155 [Verrucomicrobiota bacterium]